MQCIKNMDRKLGPDPYPVRQLTDVMRNAPVLLLLSKAGTLLMFKQECLCLSTSG